MEELLEPSTTTVRTFELGEYRRARVWLGDLPDASYSSITTLSHAIAAHEESQNELRLAAVEVFVPAGGRFMYGLLGGEWHPDPTGQLNINVSISSSNERLFDQSLAMKNDEVRVGLPAEYSQAVLAGIEFAKSELNELPSGKLSINCAAHGVVGSCEAVYKHLAAILVKLFNGVGVEPSNEDLVNLFPATFS